MMVKREALVLVMMIWSVAAFGQGIKFEKDLSWQQLKSKAKTENKYIFLDVMATWCGPCKVMEREVYTEPTVGEIFNEKFLSVKVQTDQTISDGEAVKKWYVAAKEISQAYVIKILPSMVFLAPDGTLAHQVSGFLDAEKLVAEAKKALDSAGQYSVLLGQFFKGKRDTGFVNKLVTMTDGMGRTIMAEKLRGVDFLNKRGSVNPVKLKSDLTGTWAINYSKCEFGKQPLNSAAKELLVKQDAARISITRSGIDQDKKFYASVEVLPFNGKQTDIPTQSNNRLKKAVLLGMPGNDLTEFTEVTYPVSKYEIEYTVKENWKLTEEGKRLTVERMVRFNTGSFTLKLVYDKK
jgi:thioredoxin-related protein